MRLQIDSVVKFLLLLTVVNSLGILGIHKISDIAASCVYVSNNLSLYQFNCQAPDISYKCRCRDPSFLGTVLLCIDDNCDTPKAVTNSYDYLETFCKLQAHTNYNFHELAVIFDNATKHAINPNSISKPLFAPVLPDRSRYNVSHDSVTNLLHHRWTATILGAILLGYWGLIVTIGLAINMGVWCVPSVSRKLNGSAQKWVQSHLVNPQLFSRNTNKKRNTTIGKTLSRVVSTFPTRLESLVISGYFVLLMIFCCVDYHLQQPNTIFGQKPCELLVYIADRTGIIAIAQIPLMFLFAGRNNVLSYVTGWSYRTFNIYHRWIARMVWVLLVVHACCYVHYSTQNNDYTNRWGLEKWVWANTALACSGIAVLFSFRTVRKTAYETFKMVHQVMAIVFLVGCWQHCKTLGWMEFVYATIVIWGFDHLIRWCKIFVSGGVVSARCEALIEWNEDYLKDDDQENEQEQGKDDEAKEYGANKEEAMEDEDRAKFIRVTISHSGWWRDYPGCYVFLYFLQPYYFWQSHPFTVIESSTESTIDQLTVIVRVKNGLTKRLARFLMKQPDYTADIPVLVEGPYGTPLAFRNYDNAMFVAAGVGLTVVYTLAVDLSRQYTAHKLRNPHCQHKICVIWVTPTVSSMQAYLPEIESLARNENIKLNIYVTQNDIEQRLGEQLDPRIATRINYISQCQHVRVVLGRRPMLKKQVIQQVNKMEGRTAVIACGPDPVNRDVRAGAGKWLKKNENRANRIDYFEEELLW